MALSKQDRRLRIKRRIRKKISGTQDRPRMSVFRSNRQISVQLINDIDKTTLLTATSGTKEIRSKEGSKSEKAQMVGKLIAEKAKEAGISNVVFDRNGYLYHGRIKALAEAARKSGLKF